MVKKLKQTISEKLLLVFIIILTIILFFMGFFHAKISLNEIFEDYIHNEKIKDFANILALILSIIIPITILILLIYKI